VTEPFLPLGGRGRALAALRAAAVEGRGLLLLVGDVGLGKTTLVRALLAALDGEAITVAVVPFPNLDARDFLRAAAKALGLDADARDPGETLRRFFVDAAAAGRRALVVVDEAQKLRRSVLPEIARLLDLGRGDAGAPGTLSVLLAGNPELELLLGEPAAAGLGDRVAVRCVIEPLDEVQTEGYVRAKLVGAGGETVAFTPDAMRAVWEFSRGVPRLVDTLCGRAREVATRRPKRRIDARDIASCIEDLGWRRRPRRPARRATGRAAVRVAAAVAATAVAAAVALSAPWATLAESLADWLPRLGWASGRERAARPAPSEREPAARPASVAEPARPVEPAPGPPPRSSAEPPATPEREPVVGRVAPVEPAPPPQRDALQPRAPSVETVLPPRPASLATSRDDPVSRREPAPRREPSPAEEPRPRAAPAEGRRTRTPPADGAGQDPTAPIRDVMRLPSPSPERDVRSPAERVVERPGPAAPAEPDPASVIDWLLKEYVPPGRGGPGADR